MNTLTENSRLLNDMLKEIQSLNEERNRLRHYIESRFYEVNKAKEDLAEAENVYQKEKRKEATLKNTMTRKDSG